MAQEKAEAHAGRDPPAGRVDLCAGSPASRSPSCLRPDRPARASPPRPAGGAAGRVLAPGSRKRRRGRGGLALGARAPEGSAFSARSLPPAFLPRPERGAGGGVGTTGEGPTDAPRTSGPRAPGNMGVLRAGLCPGLTQDMVQLLKSGGIKTGDRGRAPVRATGLAPALPGGPFPSLLRPRGARKRGGGGEPRPWEGRTPHRVPATAPGPTVPPVRAGAGKSSADGPGLPPCPSTPLVSFSVVELVSADLEEVAQKCGLSYKVS